MFVCAEHLPQLLAQDLFLRRNGRKLVLNQTCVAPSLVFLSLNGVKAGSGFHGVTRSARRHCNFWVKTPLGLVLESNELLVWSGYI